jgi:hypothetical protein
MKIARLAAAALTVVLAISVVMASAAFAAPTFVPTGATFVGTSGAAVLEADAGERLRCETSTWSGDVTSATSAGNLVVHFLGCTDTTAEGEKCSVKSTNTTVAGLILINTSRAVLGLVLPKPVSGSDVGLLVLPASGRVFTTLVGSGKCVETTKVSGSVAGLAEPVGSLQTTGKVVFAQTGGKQDIADLDLSTGGLVDPELTAFSTTVVGEGTEELSLSAATEVT